MKVDGMMCMHCVQSVREGLERLGISDVDISLQDKAVSFDGNDALKVRAIEIIEDLGFEVK